MIPNSGRWTCLSLGIIASSSSARIRNQHATAALYNRSSAFLVQHSQQTFLIAGNVPSPVFCEFPATIIPAASGTGNATLPL